MLILDPFASEGSLSDPDQVLDQASDPSEGSAHGSAELYVLRSGDPVTGLFCYVTLPVIRDPDTRKCYVHTLWYRSLCVSDTY